ncbi:MAG: biopolymer transporter ExbD [Pseudomonadota bacterium]
MTRLSLEQRLAAREEARVELSPLIDVVFILLIFFIVSTVFVKESGIEVDKPSAVSAQELDKHVIIIAISRDGEVVHAGASIGVAGVRATLEPLLQERDTPVVVQTDAAVPAELLVKVIDQVKLAGSASVHIATSAVQR